MFVSRKTRYAIRGLVELGIQYEKQKRPIRLHSIAKRQCISTRYLENIFNLLADNGIIRGIKGKGGGFIPARPAKEIALSQIITVLENPGKEFECITGKKSCVLSNDCNSVSFWKDYFHTMDVFFRKYSLQDLMEQSIGKISKSHN
jgi:Rrf2 family protein